VAHPHEAFGSERNERVANALDTDVGKRSEVNARLRESARIGATRPLTTSGVERGRSTLRAARSGSATTSAGNHMIRCSLESSLGSGYQIAAERVSRR